MSESFVSSSVSSSCGRAIGTGFAATKVAARTVKRASVVNCILGVLEEGWSCNLSVGFFGFEITKASEFGGGLRGSCSLGL